MFFGKYEHNLDDKQRLMIPSKFRAKLSSIIYISKGFEGSLELRTEIEYMKWVEEITSTSQLNNEVRALSRHIMANTAEVEIDKIGRIKIPAHILSLANIEKDVCILGLGNKIEIWSKTKFEHYTEQTLLEVEQLAENLATKVTKTHE